MVCIPRERFGSSLGKAHFSFVNGYQLEVASGLRMGLVSPSPLLALGPHLVQSCVGPVHAATSALTNGLCAT